MDRLLGLLLRRALGGRASGRRTGGGRSGSGGATLGRGGRIPLGLATLLGPRLEALLPHLHVLGVRLELRAAFLVLLAGLGRLLGRLVDFLHLLPGVLEL